VEDRASELTSRNSNQHGERPLRLCVSTAQATDVGLQRRSNQDSHLVLRLDSHNVPQDTVPVFFDITDGRLLAAVADGMGGHYGGEIASRLCVENLAQQIVEQLQFSGGDSSNFPLALQRSVEAAHDAVFLHAQNSGENRVIGTTLTAALLHGARAEFAQVGDSRAYVFRDGNLLLLTQDQTIENDLHRQGEDASRLNEQIRNMLTQALGAQREIQVVMSGLDLQPGDSVLLCCDGLYKAVSAADIVEILQQPCWASERATRLVACANEHGGPDNITVILIDVFPVESTS
jgi:PPM family protein phosphatase